MRPSVLKVSAKRNSFQFCKNRKMATVAIFLFLQNWNEFLFALTFITEGRMRTLPTGIYALLSSEFYGNYPILAASLVLFSVPVLVLYFLFQQQFIEGLTAGALKQ